MQTIQEARSGSLGILKDCMQVKVPLTPEWHVPLASKLGTAPPHLLLASILHTLVLSSDHILRK